MLEKIKDLMAEVENFAVDTKEKAEELRLKYLSKKGVLNEIFAEFKKVKPEEKREYGQKINSLKTLVENKIAAAQEAFEDQMSKPNDLDITLPGPNYNLGSHHPITMVKNEIIEIFSRLGFTVAEGQEIEDDYHNFTALNFPPEHPARDMQDTFFIETNPDILLRTHTSGGQVRVMEKQKPPIRVLVPGRVFRNEAVSARSHCIFHQIEGLYIDNSGNLCASATSDYSAGDHIDITDNTISVTGTEEADSMGIGEHLYIDGSGNLNVSATETNSMGIGEGLYIDNSGNLCASATGGANYSAGEHIDITDDTISVTGIEETDSLGLGEHLYVDASGNIDVSATETDSMGIGEGLYLDASGNLCASATGGANYSAGAFIDITDNVISVTDTAEADSLGLGDSLYIDNSGNINVSAVEASALGIGEGLYIDDSGNLCASVTGAGTQYSAIAPVYIENDGIGVSSKEFNLTAPLVMTEDASAVNITVSAKDFEVASPLYLSENNSAVTLGISGILYESGFGYDSNSAISGYNGSAFAGGSALPISAGQGVKLDIVNNTLVVSTDETVLYSGYENVGNDGAATYNLSELPTNFNKIKVYWCLRNNSQFEQDNKGVGSVEYDMNLYSADHTYIAGFMEGASDNTAFQPYRYDANIANIRTTSWNQNGRLVRLDDNQVLANNAQWFHIYKVIGINRKA
jgi:hypothetical protein